MEENDLGLQTEELVLNFGPSHPATHGTLQLVMELSGEVVVKVTPQMGYLHTGFEKLSEHLDYNQFICVTDRMNYLSPLNNNIGFALAVEKLLGIDVPPRAQYIRVIMAELSRIIDHLLSLGAQALDVGAFTVFIYFYEEREKLYNLFEWVCGSRLTTTYMRIGGLMRDLPEGYEDGVIDFCKGLPKVLKEVETLLNRNKIFIGRTRDVGTISGEEAINRGITGPVLRASNVEWDIRKVEPYLVYNELDFDVPVGENGDVYDRYIVRMEEMRQSLRIIEQAVEKLPGGPVDIDDPKIRIPKKDEVYNTMEGMIHHFEIFMKDRGFIPPVGEVYLGTESPNGELGFFIVSDGGRSPYRVRVRPPCFFNYQAFPVMLEGSMLSDAVAILGSLNVIAGELDR
ncbi:NADH dehydrogenase (quinone) subunit D [candidate division KSB1 bacterium]